MSQVVLMLYWSGSIVKGHHISLWKFRLFTLYESKSWIIHFNEILVVKQSLNQDGFLD